MARMGGNRDAYRLLVGKPDGRRPHGGSRCRFEEIIKIDLQELGLGGIDWIEQAQNRARWRSLMNAIMNLRVA